MAKQYEALKNLGFNPNAKNAFDARYNENDLEARTNLPWAFNTAITSHSLKPLHVEGPQQQVNILLEQATMMAFVTYYLEKHAIHTTLNPLTRLFSGNHGTPGMKRATDYQTKLTTLVQNHNRNLLDSDSSLTPKLLAFIQDKLINGTNQKHLGKTSLRTCLMRNLSALFLYETSEAKNHFADAEKFYSSDTQAIKPYLDAVIEKFKDGTTVEQVKDMLKLLDSKKEALAEWENNNADNLLNDFKP